MEKSIECVLEDLRNFSTDFNDEARNQQTARCSKLIETLLQNEYDDSREAINLLRTLIRLSSESHDYRATVDFVSVLVLESITEKALQKGKLLKRHLDGAGYHHEHMYPCAAAMSTIREKGFAGPELTAWLAKINFRALIDSKKEELALNEQYKSSVPEHPIDCPNPALSRYCATGILGDLRPVSSRGKKQLEIVESNRRCKECSVKKAGK